MITPEEMQKNMNGKFFNETILLACNGNRPEWQSALAGNMGAFLAYNGEAYPTADFQSIRDSSDYEDQDYVHYRVNSPFGGMLVSTRYIYRPRQDWQQECTANYYQFGGWQQQYNNYYYSPYYQQQLQYYQQQEININNTLNDCSYYRMMPSLDLLNWKQQVEQFLANDQAQQSYLANTYSQLYNQYSGLASVNPMEIR